MSLPSQSYAILPNFLYINPAKNPVNPVNSAIVKIRCSSIWNLVISDKEGTLNLFFKKTFIKQKIL